METELWNVISATVLDTDHLERGLEAAGSQHDDSDRMRQERLTAIDTELSRQRRRLDTLAERLIDAGEGEIYQAMMRQAKEIEELLSKLNRERTDLASIRTEGLTEGEALSIREFAHEIAEGLVNATSAEKRQIIELLDIRGALYVDPDGIPLTKNSRFRIDWSAVIGLRHSDPTFINLGVPHPDPARFTALIWIPNRYNFDPPAEVAYVGLTICVTGVVELYEGIAEIEVVGPWQIYVP